MKKQKQVDALRKTLFGLIDAGKGLANLESTISEKQSRPASEDFARAASDESLVQNYTWPAILQSLRFNIEGFWDWHKLATRCLEQFPADLIDEPSPMPAADRRTAKLRRNLLLLPDRIAKTCDGQWEQFYWHGRLGEAWDRQLREIGEFHDLLVGLKAENGNQQGDQGYLTTTVGIPNKPVVKKASANARMIDMMLKRPESKHWTAAEWTAALGYRSESTIKETPTWTELKKLRAAVKAERRLEAAEREVGSRRRS